MLNLQTIAESLNTKCAGRAWVFVTSQEDMDKVVGDRTKQQGNDFSKIQARFKTRVKLTSADVEEVIRKRLLEKNDAGASALKSIYAKESANFKTLFDFVDGAKTYRNYTDEAHFVGTYPFVSYQFPLFQAAIEGISDHNVFEGRNSSVGERSMLGVVQQVAKDIGDVEVGTLATFDHMFAGIRASLKSAAQRSIDVAERNLDNQLAIRLLKALFLVKYVESFQATPRNLTVLVYDRFGLDLPALAEDVKEALTLLETQTYVQRNGNVYEYLTNEEQVIEEEIKNVDIDASEVSAQLFKILSGDVIKTSKIRYAKNGQDFPFGFKLDDQVHGPQKELSVHFITPEYPYTPDETRMHSAGKDELRVILEPDERVLSDLRLLLKTEKYTKRKQTTSLSAIEEQILQLEGDAEPRAREGARPAHPERGGQGHAGHQRRRRDLASSQDALGRVTEGFQDLISRTYTQLKLLGGVTYSEQQVAGAANPDSGLFDADALLKIDQPAEEVLSFILRKDGTGRAGDDEDDRRHLPGQALRLGPRLDRGDRRVADRRLEDHADGRRQRPQAQRGRHSAAQHAEALARRSSPRRRPSTSARSPPSASSAPTSSTRATHRRTRWSWPATAPTSSRASSTSSRPPSAARSTRSSSSSAAPSACSSRPSASPTTGTSTTSTSATTCSKPRRTSSTRSSRSSTERSGRSTTRPSTLLSTHSSNLGYLPPGSDETVKTALADPNAFRGNKMAQLKQAADELAQPDRRGRRREPRRRSRARSRAARPSCSPAPTTPRQRRRHSSASTSASTRRSRGSRPRARSPSSSRSDRTSSRATTRLCSTCSPHPRSSLIRDPTPAKQTVSVKTIAVPGASGVLETEADVDKYLAALRSALVQTLNDGKRISL